MSTRQRTGTGQCLCGAVHFHYKGDPLWVGHCHCHSCRRNTGCAVVTFVGYAPEKIVFTTDSRKYFQSSVGVRRGFCPDCGTPVSYESDRYPTEIHLYVSAFDRPDEFEPTHHVYFSEKIRWFDCADDLKRLPTTGATPKN
jgi:hypothetical protein